ncbi:MAG: DNA replication/repair protein RecF [Ruminococcus sp.]|nr:DNA replication/repair protein RecF [Ruminococcus sp.]
MYVTKLQFKNYRNLCDDVVKPCEKINVIYGNNAQGKTNILEALWLFCGGHSFKGSKENEFIKFGEKFAKINAEFFSQGREQSAEIIFNGIKKEVFINGVKKNSSAALIEKFNAVVFSPEDLTLVKRGPSARRRFIDSAICREKLKNAIVISKYNQTLNQRNALLKDIYRHPELKNTLEIWDDTLCSLGAKIIFQRLSYIEKLSSDAREYHFGISDNTEKLEIIYNSNCGAKTGDSEGEIFEKLSGALKSSKKEDINSGYTNIGPHRDDFDIFINDRKAKIFASQGQQRSAVLSLKLAEANVLSTLTGENPVILLDDVLSELDSKRRDFLLNKIKDYQVFITTCELNEEEALKEGKKFLIKEGKIS